MRTAHKHCPHGLQGEKSNVRARVLVTLVLGWTLKLLSWLTVDMSVPSAGDAAHRASREAAECICNRPSVHSRLQTHCPSQIHFER